VGREQEMAIAQDARLVGSRVGMDCAGRAALAIARVMVCAGLLGVGAGVVGMTAGCQRALFPPDAPRSQYDRIDTIRDRRPPAYFFDEFGTRRPNLRGRLLNGE
jgi:hypothetical protein